MTPEAACLILGVSASSGVDEIRSAYKRLILLHHPDRVEPSRREEATRLAREVNAAYGLLMAQLGSDTTAPAWQESEPSYEHPAGPSTSEPPAPPEPPVSPADPSGKTSPSNPFVKIYTMDFSWSPNQVFSVVRRSVEEFGWRIREIEPVHRWLRCTSGMTGKSWAGQEMVIHVIGLGANRSRVQVDARTRVGGDWFGKSSERLALTTKLFDRTKGLLESGSHS